MPVSWRHLARAYIGGARDSECLTWTEHLPPFPTVWAAISGPPPPTLQPRDIAWSGQTPTCSLTASA